jgi:hypothetical protein
LAYLWDQLAKKRSFWGWSSKQLKTREILYCHHGMHDDVKHQACIINHVAHGDVTKTFSNNSKHVVIIAAF